MADDKELKNLFESMTEDQKFWAIIILMLSFSTEKDMEKLRKMKENLEKELDKQ
jgi:hypothetical protein